MIIYAITRGSVLRGLSLWLLGFLLGATCTMLFVAGTIDTTLIERETLESELSEHKSRIDRLESSLKQRRTRVVQGVEIVMDVRDPHLNLKLTQIARELVDEVIGKEVDSLDAPLIATIFNGRIVTIEGQSYTFQLDLLVISDTLGLYLSVVPGTMNFSE